MFHITKTYPGVRALEDVSLEVLPGEVHALMGENGAGKSTLMKILAGAQPRDSGEIRIDGRAVQIESPQQAMDLGISVIYQEFNLVPYLNAAENIFLGREPAARAPGFVDFGRMYREAESIIGRLGVPIDARMPVSRLSIAQQQMVEIAKATSRRCRIIVMDEPSATLTEHELQSLFQLIRQLKADGVAIVYISHRLEEVFEICDRVTVLRDGHGIATHGIDELTRDDIIRLMVGRELTQMIPKEVATIGEPALEVRRLARKGVLHDVSLTVHRGEVVGLAGLVGAGRTELARAIFGADPIDGGTILVHGREVRVSSPQEAIRLGIGLVTEDRKAQGLVLGMAVRENITLANLRSLSRFSFISSTRERAAARRYVADLGVKTPTIEQTVQNLSGGNQQKVVLAKWLFTDSKVLLFDEPTRGIDVGAKTEIYQLMNRLTAAGVGILMISSELPEVLGMSDRILVMHGGRIAGELSRVEATQERIMQLATGGE
ncbi:MAG: sugar ABC transporter ATP-binding protein [Chthonomonadales bacterium]|nr:sugar ABC transporter ATP-binding protein [Chthonomonadales bacterium]